MGLLILLVDFLFKDKQGIRFLPQDFQPFRKKIIFGLMSASAWVTILINFAGKPLLPNFIR